MFLHTIRDRKTYPILVRHPSITDFHLFAFSCLHLSIYPSTYLYLTVRLNDIHIIRILLVPLASLAANVRAKRTALYKNLNKPKWTNAKASFHLTLSHWDKEMYVSNEPSYLCQSNHGTIMENYPSKSVTYPIFLATKPQELFQTSNIFFSQLKGSNVEVFCP